MLHRASLVLRAVPTALLASALIWGSAWIIVSAHQSHLDVAVVVFGVSALLLVTCWHVPSAIGGVLFGAGGVAGGVSVLLLLPGGLYWQAFVAFCVVCSLAVASYLIGLFWSVRHLPSAERLAVLQGAAERVRRRNRARW